MGPTRPAALLLALAMLVSHASHAQAPEPPPGAAVYVDARMMTTEEVAAGFDVGNAVFGSAAGVFVAPAGLWGGVSAPRDLRGAGVAGNPYVTGTW